MLFTEKGQEKMDNVVIMFVCAGGMSSSLVVSKMQKAAEEKGLTAEIWATGVGRGKEILKDRADIDALLIGPQVRFSAIELEKVAEEKNRDTVIHVADMKDYGMVNGEKILTDILKKLEVKNLS